jgi:hypothetical protein
MSGMSRFEGGFPVFTEKFPTHSPGLRTTITYVSGTTVGVEH